MHCKRRLIVQSLVSSRSYLHSQVSPTETIVVKGGTTWARNGRLILPENARLPRNIQGSFRRRKSTTRDKRLYFPSEGRRAEDFFALKIPTASAGFEPANLGTKGQHATYRPPKPLFRLVRLCVHLVACLKTGPKPLSKRVLHTVLIYCFFSIFIILPFRCGHRVAAYFFFLVPL